MAKNPLDIIGEFAGKFAANRATAAEPVTDREFSHVVYMRDAKTKDYLIVNRNGIIHGKKHTIYPGPILPTMQIGTHIAPDTGNAWKIRAIVHYLPPSKRAGRAVTVFWLDEARSYHPDPT